MSGLRLKVDNRARARAEVLQAAEHGIDDALEFLGEEANRTVPIEEETLTRSQTVTREGLRGAVAYDTAYAVRQHEDTRLRHDEGRRAKWLQATFRENGKAALQHIADVMKGRVR